jgi:molecular chaperone GrpE
MNSSASESGERVAPGEIEELRKALDEEQQRYLRLLAEFDNFRRRMARDAQGSRDAGRREALLPLLDVFDMLERGLAAGSTDPAFYEGVAATKRLFVSALGRAGVEPISTLGTTFDPKVHEAVATLPSATVDPGTIVREERSGWRLGEDLLRPAQVVVAASPEAVERWP